MDKALKHKERGNKLFVSNKLRDALTQYHLSLESLNVNSKNKSEITLIAKIHNNIALIYYKLKDVEQCVRSSNNVLNVDPNNIKAQVRRAQALLYLNKEDHTFEELDMIRSSFKKTKESLTSYSEDSKYLSVINKEIKFINQQMKKMKKRQSLMTKQQLYSSYFAPKPSQKVDLSQIDSFESNINCIMSMYAHDYINMDKFNETLHSQPIRFRLSPVDITCKWKKKVLSLNKDVVHFDEYCEQRIAFFHIGSSESSPKQFHFETSNFKWPKMYTFILWVKWEKDMHLITTFDSEVNAPIYIDRNRIGCASAVGSAFAFNGWQCVDDYKINPNDDKWCFVAALGGNGCTKIYIGDIDDTLPELIGSVKSDIAEQLTWRIGNESQGPGKVANILVFDGHLSDNDLETVYYQSRNEMIVPITDQEMENVQTMLLKQLQAPELARIILEYIRYFDF